MSATNVQHEFYVVEWQLDLGYSEQSAVVPSDHSIDDPVNDTGFGPRRGDLQLSDEFACLLSLICEGSGDFS